MPKERIAKFCADTKEFLLRRHITLPPEIRNSGKLNDAISTVTRRWPETANTVASAGKPIFIFSAGWRSGSTLLQRLIMSSNQVIIWGEPLGDTAILPRLAASMSIIGNDWPPDHFFPGNRSANSLAGEWIANLTPDMKHFLEAHRSFLVTWLAGSAAADYGFKRWGLKEVRFTMDHARYLGWLFPDARFLFIVRNPANALRSWKGNRWRSPWPGYYRNAAIAFTRHWSRLTGSFLAGHKDVGGMLIRYEDLISRTTDLARLADYLELEQLDAAVLDRKIASPSDKQPPRKRELSIIDRLVVSTVCGKLMKQLNYR